MGLILLKYRIAIFFVGLTVGVGVYFILESFPSVEIELIHHKAKSKSRDVSWLIDLDNDGNAEQVVKKYDKNGYASVHILKSNSGDYQSNFLGEWLDEQPLYFGDYNQNDTLEVYGLQYSEDSLFLCGVEYPKHKLIDRKFITSGFSNISSTKFLIQILPFQNRCNQLFVTVQGGYGAQPRNIFVYDFLNKKLIKTADSIQNYQQFFTTFDVNGDADLELITWGRAPDNNHDGAFFSDQDSYVLIYDTNVRLIHWYKSRGYPSCTFFKEVSEKGFIGLYNGETQETKVFRLLPNYEIELVRIIQKERIAFLNIIAQLPETIILSLNDNRLYWVALEKDFVFDKQVLIKGNYYPLKILLNGAIVYRKRSNNDLYFSKSIAENPTLIEGMKHTPNLGISFGLWEGEETLLLSQTEGDYFYSITNSFVAYNKLWISLAISVGLSFFLIGVYRGVVFFGKEKTGQFLDVLRINTRTGFELIPLEEILYCKADGKYTIVQTIDNGEVISSTNLGAIVKELFGDNFIRLGRSIIVNKSYIRKVDRKKATVIFKIQHETKELKIGVREIKTLSKEFE